MVSHEVADQRQRGLWYEKQKQSWRKKSCRFLKDIERHIGWLAIA